MGKMHYHVGENQPGYLPEGDIDTATTVRDRDALMVARAWRYRDDVEGRYRVEGNRRDGYDVSDRDASSHHLGTVIWWMECGELECEFGEVE